VTADAIVLGLGGMGSAAAFHLARRGLSVLGFEQFPLGHDRGSSHGQTRIIRTAYYEHPAYVPLVRRASDLWRELEAVVDRELLTPCPCLNVGAPEGEVILGVRAAAREHGLMVEELSASEIERRFPAFRIPASSVGILEGDAGSLAVEACVLAHQAAALRTGRVAFGAEERVLSWRPLGEGVEVTTTAGTHTAEKLIVTAGAWAGRMLGDIGLPLTVMRQVMHWFDADPTRFRAGALPIFFVETPDGAFYGLPSFDGRTFKCARHYGATELDSPDRIDWKTSLADEARLRPFLHLYLPDAGGCTASQVCMYTLTPDRHFIIDLHPEHPQVVIAAGFSGHGFKFAPTVGEILADLTTAGRTAHAIDLFRIGRFGRFTPAA
jgi:sarcosine oxidase